MDVATVSGVAPDASLWRNVEGKKFERVPLPVPADVKGALGVTPIDVDNDGWIDLAVRCWRRHMGRRCGCSGIWGRKDLKT